jgi:hypothetical protein
MKRWLTRLTPDDAGYSRLMPSLHSRIFRAPHGSIVLVDSARVAARVFDGNAISSNEYPIPRPSK